jgi:hypothetical protein
MNTYIIYIGLGVLFLLVLYGQPRTVTEGFIGPFGASKPKKIPFMTMIKNKYTPDELKDWQQKWSALPLDEKNKQIADWDAIKAAEQNQIFATEGKQAASRHSVSKHFDGA